MEVKMCVPSQIQRAVQVKTRDSKTMRCSLMLLASTYVCTLGAHSDNLNFPHIARFVGLRAVASVGATLHGSVSDLGHDFRLSC
jgi:hypothetical protein